MDERSPRLSGTSTQSDTEMTVGQTAAAIGISVRTLHHWDAIGLVVPSARTHSGYRLYDSADAARLHRVLVYRELGFPLERIRQLLDDPCVLEGEHLLAQRALLNDRIARLQQMVCAVDSMMEANTMNTPLTPRQQADAFGADWSDAYAAEAEERWGGTPEWEQSERVKAQMTSADFAQAKAEMEELDERLAEAKRRGVAPGSPEADALAGEHRGRAIGRWFSVTPSKHALIARGYTEDPRFTRYYDDREPGLAAWLREVIEARAVRDGVDLETIAWE